MSEPELSLHHRILLAEAYKRIAPSLYWDENLNEIKLTLECLNDDLRYRVVTRRQPFNLTSHMVCRYGGNPNIHPINPQWNTEREFFAYGNTRTPFIESDICKELKRELLGDNIRYKYRKAPNTDKLIAENLDTLNNHLRRNLVCQARSVDGLVTLLQCLPPDKRLQAMLDLRCKNDGTSEFMNINSKYLFFDELFVKTCDIFPASDFKKLLLERDSDGRTLLLKISQEKINGNSMLLREKCYKICEILQIALNLASDSGKLDLIHTADFHGHTITDLAIRSESACILDSIMKNLTSTERIEYLGTALYDAVIHDTQQKLPPVTMLTMGVKIPCCHSQPCNRSRAAKILQCINEAERMVLLQTKDELSENTPLHLVADEKIFHDILQTIVIEERVRILSQQNAENNTPLHIHPQHISTLDELLNPVDVLSLCEIQNSSGETILHCALKGPATSDLGIYILPTLKILNLTFLELQDSTGCTVFHKLAKHEDLLLFLLIFVPESDALRVLSLKNNEDSTVLHHLDYKNSKFISAVLTKISNVDERLAILTNLDKKDVTPFQAMVQQGFYQTIQIVFEKLERNHKLQLVNVQDQDGYSSFHMAVHAKSGIIFKAILDQLSETEIFDSLKLKDKRGKTAIHLAIAGDLKYAVQCVSEAIGLKQTLEILDIAMTDSEVHDLEALTENEDIDRIKQCLQRYDSNARHMITSVVNSTITSHSWSNAIKELDDHELQEIAQKITEASSQHLVTVIHELERKRFQNDATVFHILAQRGDSERLQKLLDAVDDVKRAEIMSLRDTNLRTPYDYARQYKVRHLLEWSSRQEGFYYLPAAPKVIVMYSTENRHSAEQETEALEKVLPRFNINVIIRLNPTKMTIVNTIRESQREDITGLIVIIMSHGFQGAICALDGDISIQEILQTMCSPTIEGKPKVLLIQACQNRDPSQPSGVSGSLADPAPPQSQRGQPPSAVSAQEEMPQHFKIQSRDVITMMATVDGDVAYRNYMIPMFAEELRDSSNNGDIYEIFVKTHEKLMKKLPTEARQIPEFRSTLTKKLCLRNIFVPRQ